MAVELERWLRGQKHQLLFQGTDIQLPALTKWIKTICNSSYSGSNTFHSFRGNQTHTWYRCIQKSYSHKSILMTMMMAIWINNNNTNNIDILSDSNKFTNLLRLLICVVQDIGALNQKTMAEDHKSLWLGELLCNSTFWTLHSYWSDDLTEDVIKKPWYC